MIIFYDSVKLTDTNVSMYEPVDKKVILDTFCMTAPEGFELAASDIRDCLEVWGRPFMYMADNDCFDTDYKVVTNYPEMYHDRSMEHALIVP